MAYRLFQQVVGYSKTSLYDQLIGAMLVARACQNFASLEYSLVERRDGKPARSSEVCVSGE